jgi:hypothetical protein
MRIYHFCVIFQKNSGEHEYLDGTIEIDCNPINNGAYEEFKERLGNMLQVPGKILTILSLSRID